MGVSNLFTKLLCHCKVEDDLSTYSNSNIGIDASIWLYRSQYNFDEYNSYNSTTHLKGRIHSSSRRQGPQ